MRHALGCAGPTFIGALIGLVQAGAAAGATPIPDTLAQRLQPCAACHGAEGRASREGFLPRIAGKPAAYLYQQLLNFRHGRRNNSTMADLLALQSDAYLREMAAHFAAIDLPYKAPPVASAEADAGVLALGRRLAQGGDPARQLPACAACHGAALTGTLPAVPGLLGLPRDYLIGQLGAWQTGNRRTLAPDCMADIARRLAPADVSAVATWLAAQPVPGAGAAAAGPVAKVGLRCAGVDTVP